jgi:alpha-tubulin suppressor-like RCC1 family protein
MSTYAWQAGSSTLYCWGWNEHGNLGVGGQPRTIVEHQGQAISDLVSNGATTLFW